jgi:diacylglycerol kinase family enzyme
MSTAIVINETSGRTQGRDFLGGASFDPKEVIRRSRFPGPVSVVAGSTVEKEMERLADRGIGRIVVGGGDGTVGAAAAVAMRRGLVLGVWPLGTRNHLARDLGVPLDPEASLKWLAGASVRRIDLGEVNGRIFINNVSVGLYPSLVRAREKAAVRVPWRKTLATPVALAQALRRYRLMHLRLQVGDRKIHRLTPFLFVGNNAYSDLRADAKRKALDGGRLWVCTAAAGSRLRLARIAWRASRGDLRRLEDLHAESLEGIVVEFRGRRELVAIDGELCEMPPPLAVSNPGGRIEGFGPEVGECPR